MVSRPGPLQASFNSGEISDELWVRSDVKQFYASAALMRNVEPLPQGGFRLIDRSRHLAVIRRFVPLTGAMTFGAASGGARTLVTFAFPAPVILAAIVFSAKAGALAPASASVEYQAVAGGPWLPFLAEKFALSPVAARRGAGRPPASGPSANAVRVVYDGSAGALDVSGLWIEAFTETETGAAGSDVQLVPFTSSLTQTYMVVLMSTGIADVYRNGVWVAVMPHALAASQVRAAVPVQRLETLLLFHPDVRQTRVVRGAGDHEWAASDVPFLEVPQVDLGGTYAKVAEVWQIVIRWPTGATPDNYGLVVSVDGQETDTIVYTPGAGWAAFVVALRAAIENLATVATGILVVDVGGSLTSKFINLAFEGADNLGSQFVVTAKIVNTAEGGASATRYVIGNPGGESLFSPSRGYAACGIFYQDRLLQGGFRPRPNAFLASPSADYFSGNILVEAATGGILQAIDTDGAETIHRFARARHLLLFTTDAEYYVADRALRRDQPVNVVESSRNGSAPGIPVCSTETNLLYVSRTRSLVYSAAYDDVAQAYVSSPLTLLAKHLLHGISGAALQRANDRIDAARYFLPRDDGVMAVGLLIQSQDVTAFVRWETDGRVVAAAIDGANRVHLAVDRPTSAGPARHFEWLEPDLWLDGAVTRTLDPPAATVSALWMHDEAQVWAIADGYAVGPFIVTGGAVTLPFAAASVTIGRWTPPRVLTLPLPREIGQRTVMQRPCRAHTVKLKLLATTSIAVGANGDRARDVPLYAGGQPTDLPQQPVWGWREIGGLAGWSDDGTVEITQVRPGALQVSAVNIQAWI